MEDTLSKRISKCFLEGLVIAFVVYLFTGGNVDLRVAVTLALVTGLALCLLDYVSPKVGHYTRVGTGLGLGLGHVGQQFGGADSGTNSGNGSLDSCGNDYFDIYTGDRSMESVSTGFDTINSNVNLQPEIIRELNLLPTPDQVDACHMKPYINTAEWAEKYAKALEGSGYKPNIVPESELSTPVGKCFNEPYRVVDGQWSDQDIFAGYNEGVVAANKMSKYSPQEHYKRI